jgi:hypothetical protein
MSPIVSDIDFADENNGWAVGWYGFVARSIDGGVSWTFQELPDPVDYPDILFSIHVISPMEAWATGRGSDVSRDGVVYHTTNGGLSWSREVVAQDPYWGYAIAGSPSGHVWIGGYEGRILKRTAPTAVHESNRTPQSFRLEQNYPNPFNPSTTIRFALPVDKRDAVSLRVYDVLGREVATLVNGQLSAGEHEVIWNADGLATGVYMYRLTIGTRSITKKMILNK